MAGRAFRTLFERFHVKKLLIVDDDHNLFSLLERLLTPAGFSCVHAADGEAGLEMFASGEYDAVVLDVMLPKLDGLEVLAEIRARDLDTPVLMLTARGEERDLVAGLEAGADDYLAKPFRSRELTARLNVLIRKSARFAHSRQEDVVAGDLILRKGDLSVVLNDAPVPASPLEFRLLEALVERPGTVVPRRELYQRLFGRKPYIEDRGLEMLISRLRKKLGACPDGRERIRAVRGEGYYWAAGGEG